MIIGFVFCVFISGVTALPPSQRVVGGTQTTIQEYPFCAAMLYSRVQNVFTHFCGATVVSKRAVLSAAHCYFGDAVSSWRVRVGSSFAHSGGSALAINQFIFHPSYEHATLNHDIIVLRTSVDMVVDGVNVQIANLATSTHIIPLHQPVWAVGWGATRYDGPGSEQLLHARIWTIALAECRTRYAQLGRTIHDRNVCAGWLDWGERGQCTRDEGGPLVENDLVIAVYSWSFQCGDPRYPGVYTRLPWLSAWVLANS